MSGQYTLYRVEYISNEDHPDYPAKEHFIADGFTKQQVDAMIESFKTSDDVTGEYFFVGDDDLVVV